VPLWLLALAISPRRNGMPVGSETGEPKVAVRMRDASRA
jgi:hypothetical protein